MAKSRRHHFSARFYQRNFSEPMFSNSIRVYESASGTWSSKPRSPNGIGWYPHLYSTICDSGERTDVFEDFLQRHVDGPAASAMKLAATKPERLTDEQRAAIALFVGFAMVRTPAMLKCASADYFEKLPKDRVDDLDQVVRMWCASTKQCFSSEARCEFMKPSLLGAIIIWAISFRDRLLKWKWTYLRTCRQYPFVTSDWPVFAQFESGDDVRLVSFPISSEVGVLINSRGDIRSDYTPQDAARAMNRQTLDRARQFVICHKNSFPADELLGEWPFKEA